MKTLNECIVSSTNGGETLSLAAAEAVIKFYKEHDVCAHIWRGGEMMWGGLQKIFDAHGIGITVKGLWPCPRFMSDDANLIPKFMRAAYANGVVLYNVSYVNYSHKDSDLTEALERLEKAVKSM